MVQVWKDMSLYDSTAEFRLHWIHTQLQECMATAATAAMAAVVVTGAGLGGGGGGGGYRLRLCPYYDCNPAGLERAYGGPQPFARDGLLFYLKQGLYEPGPCPLVLQWKDAASSR